MSIIIQNANKINEKERPHRYELPVMDYPGDRSALNGRKHPTPYDKDPTGTETCRVLIF
jgi:hypothetical protein